MKENERKMDITAIQHALYTVNRHAKTAIDSSELYYLKRKTIKKLLSENLAKKLYLEYSNNPSRGLQSSVVVVEVGTENCKTPYYFHTIAEKEDFKNLQHKGKMNQEMRNTQVNMSLNKAKNILYNYLDEKPKKKIQPSYKRNKHLQTNIFTSSFLDGKRNY